MKVLVNIALVAAVVSLVVAVISRLSLRPLPIGYGVGIEANALLTFANTCLLIAITFILMQMSKK